MEKNKIEESIQQSEIQLIKAVKNESEYAIWSMEQVKTLEDDIYMDQQIFA